VLDSDPEVQPDPPADHTMPPTARQPGGTSGRILPVERLGAFIEVLLCSGLPTQLLVIGALSALGLRPRLEDGGWSPTFVIAMSLLDMVLVLGLVYLFLRAHRESPVAFLLGPRRPGREAAIGLALVPAALVLVVLVLATILAISPELHNVEVNPFERLLQTPRDAAIFAVVVMLAGGVREEVQRGFIIYRFDQYLGGGVLGIVLFSTMFGLGHVEQGYAAAIATGVLGAAWGVVYLVRRSVVAPVVSHAGFNLAQLVRYVALSHAVVPMLHASPG
jgi:membrane protease YdiL (CAAX protease family)